MRTYDAIATMRTGVITILALVVLGLICATPASSKVLGAFRVVTPAGTTAWVRGADARAWWHDELVGRPGDCGCRSPESTARFVHKLAKKWAHWPTPLLIVLAHHVAPMLYYAASGKARPYLVEPGALGDEHGRQWDEWRVVTPRMQQILAAALRRDTSSFPTAWGVGGGVGAVALVGLMFAAWRRNGVRAGTRFASSLLP
jgi:hypothetical protein